MSEIVQLRLSDLKYYDMGLVAADPNANTEALAADVKKRGILTPLIVRPVGDVYEVLDGLARWKAAIIVGLDTVPAIVKKVSLSDAEAFNRRLEANRSSR
jgi:ParB/RepB/Spo0J family partition protein